MKCFKHGIEMVEQGDAPDSVWYCQDCELEKETEIEARNEPDEFDEPIPDVIREMWFKWDKEDGISP